MLPRHRRPLPKEVDVFILTEAQIDDSDVIIEGLACAIGLTMKWRRNYVIFEHGVNGRWCLVEDLAQKWMYYEGFCKYVSTRSPAI